MIEWLNVASTTTSSTETDDTIFVEQIIVNIVQAKLCILLVPTSVLTIFKRRDVGPWLPFICLSGCFRYQMSEV